MANHMEGSSTSDGFVIPCDQAVTYIDSQGLLQFHQRLDPQLYHHQDDEGMKKLMSDENNGINFDEQGDVRCYDGGKDIRGPMWKRVRWTEQMVKLLINVVSFVEEDNSSDCCLGGSRRKPAMLQKIGKWKCVSNIMVEMGFHVSPQQCEDKFSDLNKRYKRLNDVLGLDTMDLSDKTNKIFSSNNLFYKEMYSYHNRNTLQYSLQLAVKQDAGSDHLNKSNLMNVMKDEIFDNPLNIDCGKTSGAAKQDEQIGVNYVDLNKSQELRMAFRSLQLKKLKLQLQVRKLEMNKQQFKWGRMNWYKNRDLDRMRLENECMKLENESLAFALEHKRSSVVRSTAIYLSEFAMSCPS